MLIRKFFAPKYSIDKLTSNAIFLWASTIVGSVTGFLFWNLAARLYTHENVGVASAVISLAQLLTGIAGLGFGSGIVRFFFKDEDPEGLLNTVLTFTFLSSCLFGVVCVMGLGIWSPRLLLLQQMLPFVVFLLLIIATTQNLVFQMVFLSLKKADITFGILTFLNVLRLAVLLFLRPVSAQGIIFSLTAATLLSNLFGFLAVNRLLHPCRFRPAISGKVLARLVPFSLANGIADFIYRLPALAGPIFVLERLGEETGAHFYIAWIIGAALIAPGFSVSQSAFAEGAADPSRLRNVIRRSMTRSFLVTLGLSAALAILASWVLSLFGTGYPQAASLLQWLCLAAPLAVINLVFLTAFRVQNRLGVLILLNVLITLSFFAPLVFLKGWALSAVGVTWMCSQLLVACLSLFFYSQRRDPAAVVGRG
jgi:O-antigen/teichoic acid export membrane protein